MAQKVYDSMQVGVIVGTTPINGLVADQAISIEVEDAQYALSTDLDGVSTRSRINKPLAKITLVLTQSSPSNDFLSTFVELDRINNSGIFPLMIKDNNGTSLFTSTAAYIEQVPTSNFAVETNTREWVIRATNITKFVGGNK